MSRVLETLEPKAVFHFFEDLPRIPHGSRNTKAISDYCVAFAKERGLWVYQDALNNVIIKKPATAGAFDVVMLLIFGLIKIGPVWNLDARNCSVLCQRLEVPVNSSS